MTIFVALFIGAACWAALQMRSRLRLQFSPALTDRRKRHDEAGDFPTEPDYTYYRMTPIQWATTAAAGALLSAAVAFVFYKRLPVAVFCLVFGLAAPRLRRRRLLARRNADLTNQFKQLLLCLSSSLSAGRSVENAFGDAVDDLKLLYPTPRTPIVAEVERIVRKLRNGEPAESALGSLSDRMGLEEIRNFVDAFRTCKRAGGNLVHVTRQTAAMINEKIEIDQEIRVMIAQKRFEAKVLAAAPVAVVALLSLSSPDYMVPMYEGPGIVIMTGAVVVLGTCLAFIGRIMNIKV